MRFPIMEPVVPPVPDADMYGITALQLLPRVSRDAYKAMSGGEQAPPFDPSRPAKLWWDSAPAGGMYNFKALDFTSGEIVDLSISEEEARTPNIPGEYEYPVYEVMETPATRRGHGSEDPLSPYVLSTKHDADQLAAEVRKAGRAAGFADFSADSSVTVVDAPISGNVLIWNGEQRRMWALNLPDGGQLNAGSQLRSKHQRGVGHPGHWRVEQIASNFVVTWQPEEPDDGMGAPEVPVPIRDLATEERVISVIGGWKVTRARDTGGGAAGGGLTQGQSNQLRENNAILKRVFGGE